jgi:TorA maturation chaperone TorD
MKYTTLSVEATTKINVLAFQKQLTMTRRGEFTCMTRVIEHMLECANSDPNLRNQVKRLRKENTEMLTRINELEAKARAYQREALNAKRS